MMSPKKCRNQEAVEPHNKSQSHDVVYQPRQLTFKTKVRRITLPQTNGHRNSSLSIERYLEKFKVPRG